MCIYVYIHIYVYIYLYLCLYYRVRPQQVGVCFGSFFLTLFDPARHEFSHARALSTRLLERAGPSDFWKGLALREAKHAKMKTEGMTYSYVTFK